MARIIIQHEGVLDIETDDEHTIRITLNGEPILNGIWSIFERYRGKEIVISVEELSQ